MNDSLLIELQKKITVSLFKKVKKVGWEPIKIHFRKLFNDFLLSTLYIYSINNYYIAAS